MFRSVPLHCIHLYDLSVYIICVYIYIYIYNMINMCTYAYDMSYVEFYIISRFWTFPANPQGTPEQQRLMSTFRCRQLLFSAANGSAHATCGDWKLLRALVDGERFLKRFQVWSILQKYDVMTTL